jgi:chromosome segregation ATPase
MFVRKGKYRDLQHRHEDLKAEIEALRAVVAQTGTLELVSIRERIAAERAELTQLEIERAALTAELQGLKDQIVETNESAMLQEFGFYEFAHPLDDVLSYKHRLDDLRRTIKDLARTDRIVGSVSGWTVNGSAREGKKLVDDSAKLMLSAYNADVENVFRTLKPHRLPAALDRIEKLRERIARNGRVMQLQISDEYHAARMAEIRLTADYLQKVEEERQRLREERDAQREEQKARREMEAEKLRLQREAAKYQTAIERLRARGDEAGIAELLQKVDEVEAAISGVEAREANIRAGYVYVISNVGSFGDHMVKIGLTRRLDPEDRIRELGDASVPVPVR